MDKLRALVEERKALLQQAVELAESMRRIPRDKHVKHDYSIVRISDLSPEEQARVIRFTHKERS